MILKINNHKVKKENICPGAHNQVEPALSLPLSGARGDIVVKTICSVSPSGDLAGGSNQEPFPEASETIAHFLILSI